ncbi:MAG: 2-oxoacid:acceptor oxidoreductase family protein [Chloroflexota bacterium]
MKEVRVHGRGGQGAVAAVGMLALAFVLEGKFARSFPMFTGFERRYAPVVGFLRFDDKPMTIQLQVYNPDCVVVLDSTLVKAVDVFAGLKKPGIAVWCEDRPVEQIPLSPAVKRIGMVDANKLALEVFGRPIANTAMLGAFAKTTGWVQISSVVTALEQKLAPALVEKNVKLATRAYELTRVVEL